MSFETVEMDREGHVGIIALDRPEQLNTFNSDLADELDKALLQLDEEEEIRVVVVKGNGKAFSAGIDVSEFPGKTEREYKEWIDLMEKPFRTIAKMKKPVIASVNGAAVANGAGLVTACDLAVAAEGAKIGTTAINVGLFCMGPAVPLSRSVGRKRCMEMLLTGDMIDARRAEEWGVVNRAVPRDELEEATMELAEKLVEKSPVALQMGKQAFYGMSDMEFEKALEYSDEVFAGLCTTEDAEEGVEAFMEDREPSWKGK